MTTTETIKDLLNRKEALRKFLNIESLTQQIAEEEKKPRPPTSGTTPRKPRK